MVEGRDILTYIGLGIDTLLLVGFYRWYRTSDRHAREVKEAETVIVDDSMVKRLQETEGKCLSYVCVEGEVNPIGQPLKSQFKEGTTGVLQKISLVEHKSRRTQGIWSDVKNVIREKLEQVPFVLKQPDVVSENDLFYRHSTDGSKVYVMEPAQAAFIMDDLTTTYDHLEVNKSSLLERGIDRLFGDVTKGYHEQEQMLLTDTMLLGIGSLVYEDGKVKLKPPISGSAYILTKLSKSEVIKSYQSSAFWAKIFLSVTVIVGGGLLVYIIWKRFSILQMKRQQQVIADEMREARLRRLTEQRPETSTNDGSTNPCVVCLTSQREILLRPCRHLCLCSNCFLALPVPRKCPVCRQDVEEYDPVYTP
ncbi:hypothetical protein CHS0354_004603 [Potamilus streckersoni]|uniref:RING-type E3 ubiquitin transferase n=1 Tax=Potamilus streckersoni TaxID=2493646 RepID=A0AAE0S4P3_9BIVA|nr:hypothetical protein CHS0354_004603 [Potamilus streckersoni]